jgi:hypothetical protein
MDKGQLFGPLLNSWISEQGGEEITAENLNQRTREFATKACKQANYAIICALFQWAHYRIESEEMLARLCLVLMRETDDSTAATRRAMLMYLVEVSAQQNIYLSPSLMDVILFYYIECDICVLGNAFKWIDMGARFQFVKLDDSSLLQRLYKHSLLVHTPRLHRCRAVVIALLGTCGRWRRAQRGELRDVAHVVCRAVWRTRRRPVWNE